MDQTPTQPRSPRRLDPVLSALDRLAQALRRSVDRHRGLVSRLRAYRDARAEGRPYREVMEENGRPHPVEELSESLRELQQHASELRRSEAEAMRDEGMTQEEIASVFGVTRQRVSTLLRQSRRSQSNDS
ncbi:MAG TPA: sigma factor-like helix-turn-helix DNA-binding protein [Acidimicrobiia bacterium]|nr:sigma factor-like helix-turn-helix DNA-binding protein [Acidimicrobiia bacterium]